MVSTAVVPVALPGECEGPEPAVSCGHGSYGMVVENNLGTAIEVELDKEVKVLYPGKSCSFDITRASEKLMKVHCRDDPSICGTRQVEDISTLRASESFGSFGGEVADFVQKEQQQVEQEKSLLQKRKDRMEAFLEKERRENAFCLGWFFVLHSTVLRLPGAMELFGPAR